MFVSHANKEDLHLKNHTVFAFFEITQQVSLRWIAIDFHRHMNPKKIEKFIGGGQKIAQRKN